MPNHTIHRPPKPTTDFVRQTETAVNHEKLRFRVRSATVADAGAVAACGNAAYRHYVERIGKAPGPMLEDYNQVITERQVLVAEREGAILGVLVLAVLNLRHGLNRLVNLRKGFRRNSGR